MAQPQAQNMVVVSAVLLSDGWHTLTAGSFGIVIDPWFLDPRTQQLVAPGEPWAQFMDDQVPPQAYACPVRSVLAVKIPALVQPPASP